ncbi:MAG: hypothetical protein KDC73_04250 [Ignavibacteriae bacterium]|nr:hypothetical protein [Ignavibacteriota bacterium]MCB9244067.1 hypothetical protein [Ignavibacteriales bacterium]
MAIDIRILSDITDVPFQLKGNEALILEDFKPVFEASENDITWIRSGIKNASELINGTSAGCIVCDEDTFDLYKENEEKLFVITSNPQIVFARLIIHFKKGNDIPQGIHPTAIIDPKCQMGEDVSIGAYCIIGACKIGSGTVVHDHVKVWGNAEIGSDCIIREFCSIGGEGFGIVKDEKGINLHVPHTGKAIIGNNVLLMPFSNIDRGTLGNTVIEDYSVIDHYCHIGHNTRVGKNSIITAGAVLSGGSSIGENAYLGVRTILKQKITIGSDVTTGMGSVVTNNIPDGEIWLGNPAQEISEFLKVRKFIKEHL